MPSYPQLNRSAVLEHSQTSDAPLVGMITDEDYHSLEFVSSGLLKAAYQDLTAAKNYFNKSQPVDRYKNGNLMPMAFGTAFHKLMLEDAPIADMDLTEVDSTKLAKMETRMILKLGLE